MKALNYSSSLASFNVPHPYPSSLPSSSALWLCPSLSYPYLANCFRTGLRRCLYPVGRPKELGDRIAYCEVS